MSKATINRIARALANGNDDTPIESSLGTALPHRGALEGRIASFLEGAERDKVPERLRKDIERVLGAIYDGEDLRGRLIHGAPEAVIIADGSRPVFFFEDDAITIKGAPNGPFVDAVVAARALLERAALSVCRIETFDLPAPERIDVYYVGTGFLVSPDLVMTNRHVAQHMLENGYDAAGPWTLRDKYWVNFDGQLGGAGRRFKVDNVEWMGPAPIFDDGDFSGLDMALLRIGIPEHLALTKPAPLAITAARPNKEQKAALIGFPGSAEVYIGEDGPLPPGYELERVLFDLFDNRFGYKRCASGRISSPVGQHPRDTRKWTVAYDLSTLGGNSGSPLLLLGSGPPVVSALHFFGEARKANCGHVFDQLGATLGAFGVPLV